VIERAHRASYRGCRQAGRAQRKEQVPRKAI